MKVEVSNGELFDKVTILRIKQEKGLQVTKELNELEPLFEQLVNKSQQTLKLFEVLKTINEQLWCIEDEKRQCEINKLFDDNFVLLSRLVYLLNDERAKIKKLVDTLTNSNITEYKSHGEIK